MQHERRRRVICFAVRLHLHEYIEKAIGQAFRSVWEQVERARSGIHLFFDESQRPSKGIVRIERHDDRTERTVAAQFELRQLGGHLVVAVAIHVRGATHEARKEGFDRRGAG